MANDFSNVIKNSVLPNLIGVLRENAVMAKLVYNDFQNEVVNKNERISITKPVTFPTPQDISFTTANTPTNVIPTKSEVVMDQWKEHVFQLSDKEIQETMITGHTPKIMESAVVSLANGVDQYILNLAKQVYQFSGTAGTTPSAVSDYTLLRKAMNDALMPDYEGARKLVIDTAAEEKFNQLFYQANTMGNKDTIERGTLVNKYNMDIMMDQNVQYQTNGASTTATIGTCAAGASVCDISGATASDTITAGTLFTVAGVTQQFVVTADTATDGAGAAAALPFDPPAPVALTGLAITFIASHRMNIGFTQNAFGIAWRPIQNTEFVRDTNSIREMMVDPVSGVPLMIEYWRDPGTMQNKVAIRLAYGGVCMNPKEAVRFLG